MRFIHLADIHASRERKSLTLSILRTLKDRAGKGDIDFIIFAGDFWDSTITATKGSGFSDILEAIRELEHKVPLYFIYGTPTHEPSGSLDAFNSERTHVYDKMCLYSNSLARVVFIPEPRRSDYITGSLKETDSLINKTIRDFLLKLKGIKDDNRPLVVVYHGEVSGAVYQNGSSASSPIAIPKEFLQSLNADYYALGHIHLPQEVFPNAWYPGSAAPKDFGETHTGSYHIVTIENGKTDVEIVSFGLPTFETLDFTGLKNFAVNSWLDSVKSDFSNRHVRIRFLCTKETRKTLNIKKAQDDIKEKTRAVSVKLAPELIENENISVSEVVKHKSVEEKMVEYAKEKGLHIPPHACELLREMQNNTLIKYAFPQHSFELLSLSLRGAIGIRDGQHKEDFSLDFSKYSDGVVCLEGQNGRGKTTFVENCHPYPCMLTREGALKDHFYLKDSHRILVYKDEDGLYYKISMLIDGKTQTGKASYFAETSKDGEMWSPIPETDGSLSAYQQWVEQTFGSIDVYLRTAFFAKEQTKGVSDISSTTKSERMELLSKLAGTDYLKGISAEARALKKNESSIVERLEFEIGSFSEYGNTIKSNEQDIKSWKNELKGLEATIEKLEGNVSDLREKNLNFQKLKAKAESDRLLYEQYKAKYDEKNTELEKIIECSSHKEIFSKSKECAEEIERMAPLIKADKDILVEKRKSLDKCLKKEAELNSDIYNLKLNIAKIGASISSYEAQNIKISATCPTCGAPLSEHKINELQSHVEAVKRQIDELLSQKEGNEQALSRKEAELSESNSKPLEDEISKIERRLSENENKSRECKDYIEQLDRLYLEHTYDSILKSREKLQAAVSELQERMDELSFADGGEDVSEKLADKEAKLQREKNRRADIEASIKSAERENEKYRKEIEKAEDKKKEMSSHKAKESAYQFIEDSFSNNGIPAIELRESAPEIAMTANRILSESYGNRFEIRFGSTSELKSGRKANEDFNILVYDSDNGDEKTIDLVSSGERIWIKQALFYAFSIVQMNRTGFNFRTRLIDESDGSLDGALRPKYLRMVEAAHRLADARLTVLITHSQEIKDIAQQFIEM